MNTIRLTLEDIRVLERDGIIPIKRVQDSPENVTIVLAEVLEVTLGKWQKMEKADEVEKLEA